MWKIRNIPFLYTVVFSRTQYCTLYSVQYIPQWAPLTKYLIFQKGSWFWLLLKVTVSRDFLCRCFCWINSFEIDKLNHFRKWLWIPFKANRGNEKKLLWLTVPSLSYALHTMSVAGFEPMEQLKLSFLSPSLYTKNLLTDRACITVGADARAYIWFLCQICAVCVNT